MRMLTAISVMRIRHTAKTIQRLMAIQPWMLTMLRAQAYRLLHEQAICVTVLLLITITTLIRPTPPQTQLAKAFTAFMLKNLHLASNIRQMRKPWQIATSSFALTHILSSKALLSFLAILKQMMLIEMLSSISSWVSLSGFRTYPATSTMAHSKAMSKAGHSERA